MNPKNLAAGVVLILVAVLFALIVTTFNVTPGGRTQAREDLVAVFDSIAVGASRQGVQAAFNQSDSRYLKLPRTSGEEEWLIPTPGEFTATNWIAWIEFCENRVGWMGIRTADGRSFHPEGAPPDKGEPGACRRKPSPTTP